MSTLSQFLGGGGIKSIQRGFTEFEGTGSESDRTTIVVPINPVVRSKSVVLSSVTGDALLVTISGGRQGTTTYSAINSTAGITLGGNPSDTTASNLIIVVGKGIGGIPVPFIGAEYNQSGIIGWQVIEYED